MGTYYAEKAANTLLRPWERESKGESESEKQVRNKSGGSTRFGAHTTSEPSKTGEKKNKQACTHKKQQGSVHTHHIIIQQNLES